MNEALRVDGAGKQSSCGRRVETIDTLWIVGGGATEKIYRQQPW